MKLEEGSLEGALSVPFLSLLAAKAKKKPGDFNASGCPKPTWSEIHRASLTRDSRNTLLRGDCLQTKGVAISHSVWAAVGTPVTE